jgi:flagellar basal body-associated protein FliL
LAERPRARPPTPGTLAPEHVLSARTRRLLVKLGIGLVVLMAARVGYHYWQTSSQGSSATSAPAPAK